MSRKIEKAIKMIDALESNIHPNVASGDYIEGTIGAYEVCKDILSEIDEEPDDYEED
jgi:hypothetical protein